MSKSYIANVRLSTIEAFEDELAVQDALDKTLHPKGKVYDSKGKLIKHTRMTDDKLNHVAWTRAACGKPLSTLDDLLQDA